MSSEVTSLQCDVFITNCFAECQEYRESWSFDFAKKEIKQAYNKAKQYNYDASEAEKDIAFMQSHPNPPVVTALAIAYENTKRILHTMQDSTIDNRQDIAIQLYKLCEQYAKDLSQENLATIDKETIAKFGFIPWDGKVTNGKVLVLIPLWAALVLPDMPVTSIFGDTQRLFACDKDNRGGCIAFGIYVNP